MQLDVSDVDARYLFAHNTTAHSGANVDDANLFYDIFRKHFKATLVQLVVPDSRGHNDSLSGGESRYVS